MKNKWIILLLIFSVLIGCQHKPNKPPETPKISSVIWYLPEWENQDLPETRIELLRFHHAVECEDCRMVGEMVLYILQHTFEQEARQGIIIYKSINSEFLENKSILEHFEVYEEDFVMNIVQDGKETILHDPKPLELAKEADKLHIYLKELLVKHLSKLAG